MAKLFQVLTNRTTTQIRNYSFRYSLYSAVQQAELERAKCPPCPSSDFNCSALNDTMSALDRELLWERAKTEGTCHHFSIRRPWCDKCPVVPINLPHCKDVARFNCGEVARPVPCDKIKCPYKSYSDFQLDHRMEKKPPKSQCEICPVSMHSWPEPPSPKSQMPCLHISRIYDPCKRIFINDSKC